MIESSFNGVYRKKRVLVTGNTGFKGSWLTTWLAFLGADVYGYSLEPPTDPSLFRLLHLEKEVSQQYADIRDFIGLREVIKRIEPDIIFHLAAQSLVGESYASPLDTIQVNTMGSVNLLEAVRQLQYCTAIIMVTSDKCYDNREWVHGYRETDPLGGYDPYSASKGAAEILIQSWRNSFFNARSIDSHGVRLASVRAGNVIGGGDWANDRIVPDCIRDLVNTGVIHVRNPQATRPWQHVLEPLHGYLSLGARLLESTNSNVVDYCEAFNFGPFIDSNRTVANLVEKLIEYWGAGTWEWVAPANIQHEASLLNLSIDKAYYRLKWLPRWDFDTAVRLTAEWYQQWVQDPASIKVATMEQIRAYMQESIPDNKDGRKEQVLL